MCAEVRRPLGRFRPHSNNTTQDFVPIEHHRVTPSSDLLPNPRGYRKRAHGLVRAPHARHHRLAISHPMQTPLPSGWRSWVQASWRCSQSRSFGAYDEFTLYFILIRCNKCFWMPRMKQLNMWNPHNCHNQDI